MGHNTRQVAAMQTLCESESQAENVVKSSGSSVNTEQPGEQVYLDLSKVIVAGDNGANELNRKYWKFIVDIKLARNRVSSARRKAGWSIQRAHGLTRWRPEESLSKLCN